MLANSGLILFSQFMEAKLANQVSSHLVSCEIFISHNKAALSEMVADNLRSKINIYYKLKKKCKNRWDNYTVADIES